MASLSEPEKPLRQTGAGKLSWVGHFSSKCLKGRPTPGIGWISLSPKETSNSIVH